MERDYSISTLKSILYNDQTFVRFIGEQGEFFNIDSNQYIKDLNNYMSLILLFDTSSISKMVFDRINSINMKYDYDYFYSYASHITNQKNTLSASFIEQILNDKNLLAMFLDFDNHPYIFLNIPLDVCLSQITLYLKKSIEKNLPISRTAYYHYQQIIRRYPLLFKNLKKLDGELPKGNVDKDLEQSVLSNVDFSKSELAIALQIYIELCKKLVYDANFLAFNQDISIPMMKNIYEKSIDEVNLEQNLVICSQFSDIYATLLRKCGFDARVRGDFHKFVVFKCNNHIVEADSSKQLMGVYDFYFCDLTRCKLNLQVGGFSYADDKEKAKEDLNRAYAELNSDVPTFMVEIIELLSKNAKRYPFAKRIEIIEQKSRMTKLQSVDYIGYILAIVKTLFSLKELNEMDLYTVYIKVGDTYEIGTLIAKDRPAENETGYYLFHNTIDNAMVSEDDVRELLNKGIIKINRKDERIKRLANSKSEESLYKGRII